jgi:hypothetical protein
MIHILCNIVYKSIGLTWLKKDMPLLLVLFGQIITQANLNRKSLGILWDVILIW